MPPRCARSAPGRAPLGYVVAPALGGGVYEDELPVIHGDEVDAVRAMRPASSRTSMSLCFKYTLIASCGLSSMFFPMTVCLSRAGARPLTRLVVRMTSAGKRQRKGGSETHMCPSFPRGALCPSEKVSRPLRWSDRGRVIAPKARRVGRALGGCLRDFSKEIAMRCCVPGRYWAVWRRSCALAGCCRPRCATGCLSGLRATCGGHAHGAPGCLVPSRSARWLGGGLGIRHGIVPGGGLRRSFRHHVDRLDGRFAYAAVLAFGLGVGRAADERAW